MTQYQEPSKVETTLAAITSSIIGIEYLLCFNNYDGLHQAGERTFRLLPIESSHFGDTPEIFASILTSGFVANKIESYGERNNNPTITKLGKALPTLTAIFVGTYYTLGESIAPYLLPGTADTKDIAAVLITAVATPFVTNFARKKWRSSWRDIVSATIRQY